jgi:hypothetical protein
MLYNHICIGIPSTLREFPINVLFREILGAFTHLDHPSAFCRLLELREARRMKHHQFRRRGGGCPANDSSCQFCLFVRGVGLTS